MEARKVAVTPVYQKLDAAYRSGRYNVFVLARPTPSSSSGYDMPSNTKTGQGVSLCHALKPHG